MSHHDNTWKDLENVMVACESKQIDLMMTVEAEY